MKKVLVFGTGEIARNSISWIKQCMVGFAYEIIGFLDNDKTKQGQYFLQYIVYAPEQIKDLSYDLILIACRSNFALEIYRQLVEQYHVSSEHIHLYTYFLQKKMRKKYALFNDQEIQDTLRYWQQHELSVFNQFIVKSVAHYDEVYFDLDAGLPYIFFDTVEGTRTRMYYPADYQFLKVDGIPVVEDVLYEQSAGSPHLYVKAGHDIKNGDVIVDAGVCEGNFSLKYINVASKIYLFEMDPVWQKPLYYTFKDYQYKVELVDKAVAAQTDGVKVCLDDVISGKVDFLKMDIEGNECAGLLGAHHLLRNNKVKCSICSYHRYGDENKIKDIFDEYGYQTQVSAGYMVFIYAADTWKHCDFRRGIVYASPK